MFAWLLMMLGDCWGVSPVGSPGHNGMPCPQGKGSCHGVASALGLGQSAPGVRVLALTTSPLHAVQRAALFMYCRASTVEEGVKKHFLSS